MRAWRVLIGKEMVELWRSRKWWWVPLVFVLLGISQPVTSYFLPELLQSAGGLPEGAVIEIPLPRPGEVLAQTLSQFSTIGLLVLALAGMGTVSGERRAGTAAMLLVKPVPRSAYLLAKWAALCALGLVSFALGYAGACYYTVVLIGPVEAGPALAAGGLYAVWLALLLTAVVAASTLLRSPPAAAFASLGGAAVLALTASLLPGWFRYSPGSLPSLAGSALMQETTADWAIVLPIASLAAAALLAVAAFKFRHTALAERGESNA